MLKICNGYFLSEVHLYGNINKEDPSMVAHIINLWIWEVGEQVCWVEESSIKESKDGHKLLKRNF